MKLKKLLSVSLCSALVITMVGCSFNPKDLVSKILTGKGNNNGNTNAVELSATVNKDAVFKETSSFTLDGMEYVDKIVTANGKFYAGATVYEYDAEMGQFEPYNEGDADVPNEPSEGETNDESEDVEPEDMNYDYNGTFAIAAFTNSSDATYTKITLDTNEYVNGGAWGVDKDENYYLCTTSYDYQTGEEHYYICKYSSDGTQIKKVEVKTDEEYTYLGSFCIADDTIFVGSNSKILIYDTELNPKTQYSLDNPESYINWVRQSDSGQIYFMFENWSSEKYETSVYSIDKDGKAKKDDSLSQMLAGKGLVSGTGYDFYYQTSSSLMAFNYGDKEAKEICNFYDSDINPSNMTGGIIFLDKEHFIMPEDAEIVFYEKVPAEQVADREIITLGTVYGSYYVSNRILDFNKSNSTYRIKLIDYSQYDTNDDYNAGTKRFNTDIASGQAPDIIIAEGYDVLNFMEKGVFTDLTPLMENGNVKKSDLTYNAQNTFAKDDKLYAVFPSFAVEALTISKENYKENMTFDDITAWEQKTGEKAFLEYTKSGILNTMMMYGMDAFLDPASGKCNFDSPEFIKILEYANSYPVDIEYSEDYDWTLYQTAYRNNKALLSNEYISSFRNFNWSMNYRFGGDAEIIRFPIDGCSGTVLYPTVILGISDKSKNKEAAWQFIETLFTDEFYGDDMTGDSFPSVQKKLDEMLEDALKPQYYTDETGKQQEMEENYWLLDKEYKVEPLTREKAEKIRDFVTNVTTVYSWDDGIDKIVREETEGYFQGQKNAKEVAGIIQSRLKVYVNEKK